MPTFSQLREWAHAAVAVLGVLAGSAAVIVALLGAFGLHVSEADVLQKIGGVGALVALLSKAIDSWNNAQVTVAVGNAPLPVVTVTSGTSATTAPPWPPPGVNPTTGGTL